MQIRCLFANHTTYADQLFLCKSHNLTPMGEVLITLEMSNHSINLCRSAVYLQITQPTHISCLFANNITLTLARMLFPMPGPAKIKICQLLHLWGEVLIPLEVSNHGIKLILGTHGKKISCRGKKFPHVEKKFHAWKKNFHAWKKISTRGNLKCIGSMRVFDKYEIGSTIGL